MQRGSMQRADGDPLASPSCAESIDLVDAALVRLVRRLTDSRMTQTVNGWAGVDVERSGFTLMARIEDAPDARLDRIAALADIDASTASRQIAKLIDQGLVERSSDPANHRVRRHRLTESGSQALIRLRRARHDWIAQSVADFSPAEQRDLADLLTRFVDNFPPQPT
jgi:DNA-binding MarR family transcriptional regulator